MNVFEESVWYLGCSTAVAALLLGTLLIVASPLALWIGVWPALGAFSKIAVVAGLIVACGIPANLVFVLAFRDRYYLAADPVVDWLPWIPSGDWILDAPCGGRYLGGASVITLRIAWALLAVPTWVLALFLYQRVVVIW